MASGNRSPLGFGPIILFHLCMLAAGVSLQNLHSRSSQAFLLVLGLGVGLGAAAAWYSRAFLWDVFRNFRSAGTLITFLVLACVLGTFIIQDLDLRRDGTFDPGVTESGEPPPFDSGNQATRFMLAESHGWLYFFPSEERKRLTAEKVVLSPVQKRQVELRRKAFGDKAARTFEQGVLASKKRQVGDLTTSNFARKHRKGLYRFYLACRWLHLFDIFEAWWFYILLGLIGVNVIVGTFARAPWNARDFGLVVTHTGIIIILTGALLDRLVAKEGYIHYVYGQPDKQVASSIFDQKTKTAHRLGFTVALERFATEYYHELFVRRIDWTRRADGSEWEGNGGGSIGTPLSAVTGYPVREGVPLRFEGETVEVVVHDYKPRVFVEAAVEEVPDGPLHPAVEMAVYRQPTGGRNLFTGRVPTWYFAKDRERSGVTGGDWRFEYVWADSGAEYDRLLDTAPVPDNGELVLRAGRESVRVKVMLGAKRRVQLGAKMLEIEFVVIRSALADADNVNLDRRLQRSEEPVLWLRVNGKQVSVPRDDSEFTSDFELLEGVEFRFDWPEPKDRGVYNIYRVVEAAGSPRVLVQADYEGQASAQKLQRGRAVALVGVLDGYYFDVVGGARRAREKRVIREVTDEQFLREGGGAKDHLLAAWADVEVKGPWGSLRREITPQDGPIEYGDAGNGRPVYHFSLFKTNMALDWFSVLTVLDKQGKRVKSHAVQVNSPLRHKGYRFFQATAGTTPDGLGVSGISVTFNPGVNYMYVGYYILVLGVCYLFFLRPVIDRDRRRGGVLFSFAGRIGRAAFWRGGHLVITGIDLAAIMLSVALGTGVLWFFILFWWVPSLWPRLALHVKRCHDVGRSGWFLLVPVWPLFETWGLTSFPGENRYGAQP